MIGTIQNIVPEPNNKIVVFYSISDDKKIIEENEHFKNTATYKEILDFVDARRIAIENIPEPNYEPLIGEVVEGVE